MTASKEASCRAGSKMSSCFIVTLEIPCRVIVRDVPRLAKEMKTGLEEAGSRARKEAAAEDLIFIGGSNFTVSDAVAYLQ